MRFWLVPVVFCALAHAQAVLQPPPAPAPSPESAKVADDAVVATIDGQKVTAGEIRRFAAVLSPAQQKAFTANPEEFVHNLFVFRYLERQAEKHNLDKASPFKELLDYARLNVLANAEINDYSNHIMVTPDEEEKFYKEHADRYQQAKVRIVYIAFSGQVKSDKKPVTEAEAKARIEELRKQIVAGADFGKVAKENSQDAASAAKNGDWGVIKRSSALPDEVKKAIFSLKPGEVSAPIRQPNGFYLFRVDEFSTLPYTEVRQQINEEIKRDRFDAWQRGIREQVKVKVENPDFFTHTAPAAATPPAH